MLPRTLSFARSFVGKGTQKPTRATPSSSLFSEAAFRSAALRSVALVKLDQCALWTQEHWGYELFSDIDGYAWYKVW